MKLQRGFGDEANFNAIAEALADARSSDEDVAKVRGGNFFRVWGEVTRTVRPSLPPPAPVPD